MTNDKANALREAAERATPGPWGVVANVAIRSYEPGHWAVATADPCRKRLANAAYIALADPPTIIALLAERERLRGALREAVSELKAIRSFTADERCDLRPQELASIGSVIHRGEQALEATDEPS